MSDENPDPRHAKYQLSPAQQQRAIEILLRHLSEPFWTDFRKLIRDNSSSAILDGTGIRNCLRLHGFKDSESPTGNLDDVWRDLAEKAATAAIGKDWTKEKKERPTRKIRSDIKGFARAVGETLWGSCHRWSDEFFTEFNRAAESAGLSFRGKEVLLRREIVILTLWIICDNWSEDKEPLDVMHDCFFSYIGTDDPDSNADTLQEINERYNYYFKSKDGTPAGFSTGLLNYLLAAGGIRMFDPALCDYTHRHYTRTIKELDSLLEAGQWGPINGKTRMDSNTLSKILWTSSMDLSEGFLRTLKSEAKSSTINPEEILILNLWIVSKVLKSDTKALDLLHDLFFKRPGRSGSLEDARLNLLARYERYYKAWDDRQGGNPMIFGGTVIELALGRETDAKMNPVLIHRVIAHTASAMKSIAEMRSRIEVSDVSEQN